MAAGPAVFAGDQVLPRPRAYGDCGSLDERRLVTGAEGGGTTAVLTGLAAIVARAPPAVDREIGLAVATVLGGWAPGLWKTALLAALSVAGVRIEEVVDYDVAFARFAPGFGAAAM